MAPKNGGELAQLLAGDRINTQEGQYIDKFPFVWLYSDPAVANRCCAGGIGNAFGMLIHQSASRDAFAASAALPVTARKLRLSAVMVRDRGPNYHERKQHRVKSDPHRIVLHPR